MERSIYSCLIDKFHCTPEEIGNLTRHQIKHLYFFPRTKHGELDQSKEPKPRKVRERRKPLARLGEELPPAPEPVKNRKKEHFEAYQTIFNLFQNKLMSQQDFDEATKKLASKFPDLFPPKTT